MKFLLVLSFLNFLGASIYAEQSKNNSATIIQCALTECKSCSLKIDTDQKQALYAKGKTVITIPQIQSFETRQVFQLQPKPSVPALGYKVIYDVDHKTATLYQFASAMKSKKIIYKNVSCN